MSAYSVIVCPRCRKHAQIIENTGMKTMRCQRCGSNLQVRKLRVLHTSDHLDEAVAARTELQARILGSDPEQREVLTIETHTDERSGRGTVRRKKDGRQIILGILRTHGKRMSIEELQRQAQGKDIRREDIGKVIEKLLAAGEIYAPIPEHVQIV
ncbi:MAG: hypothetical protein U9N13_01515 [Euryarchaeota archaeon]|nr:hypothetical protein [Euryarchaeota archaeon]